MKLAVKWWTRAGFLFGLLLWLFGEFIFQGNFFLHFFPYTLLFPLIQKVMVTSSFFLVIGIAISAASPFLNILFWTFLFNRLGRFINRNKPDREAQRQHLSKRELRKKKKVVYTWTSFLLLAGVAFTLLFSIFAGAVCKAKDIAGCDGPESGGFIWMLPYFPYALFTFGFNFIPSSEGAFYNAGNLLFNAPYVIFFNIILWGIFGFYYGSKKAAERFK